MILTGKAKEDFEKGIIEILKQKYNEKIDDNKRAIDWIYDSNDLILLAHIIEWFDSVGIYIIITPSDNPKNWLYTILGEDIMSPFYEIYKSLDNYQNREEAIKQAIITAKDIYNNLNK